MTKQKNHSLSDAFIKSLVTFLAVFVCSGYISTTYLPELPMLTVAAVTAISALAFSIPTAFGFSPLWGWLVLLLTFFAGKQAFYDIPYAVELKYECISREIFEYTPDYYLPNESDIASYVILLAVFASLAAFIFARCFFKHKTLFAVLLTVAVMAVSFLGYERANPVFLIFSVMLLCLIWAFETGFARERKGNIRFAALTLAFLVIAGVFSLNYASVAESMRELAAELKLNELRASLTGDDDFPIYLPAESGGAYASVGMDDVRFADKPVYYAYLYGYGYTGDIYLESISYYDFGGTEWSNSTRTMQFNADSEIIDYNGLGRLVRVDGIEGNMPYFLWSEEHTFENYTVTDKKDLPGYTARLHLPLPPTDTNYIETLLKDAYVGEQLRDGDFSQNYVSDVDFAALARSLLTEAGISPEEWYNPYYEITADDIKAVIAEVGGFLSQMKYTTTPTRSESYTKYDKKRSPIYNFIYNTHEGYCVHFATTAALILREMGFTTRYTIGYSFEIGYSGSAEVLDSDSHAWAEIYFKNVGWVPIEMTYGNGGVGEGSDTSGSDNSDASAESETSFYESQGESEPQSRPEESDSSDVQTSSAEPSEAENSKPAVSNVASADDSSAVAIPPVTKKQFPTAAVLTCSAILAVAVAVIAVTRSIQKNCEKRRRKFENSRYADGEQAVGAVRTDWRFVLGIFRLLGEKPDESDIMSFAAHVDEKYPDVPQLAPHIMSFLAAEFGKIASSDDAKSCGDYVLALNDSVAKRLSLPKRISAYISGKLLISKR